MELQVALAVVCIALSSVGFFALGYLVRDQRAKREVEDWAHMYLEVALKQTFPADVPRDRV